MRDFGKSRTIYSVRWPEIRSMLGDMRVSDYYASLVQRREIKSRADQIGQSIRNWLSPIVDLGDLSYAYPTSGTHHAIEQWLASETRRVCCLVGEYPYPRNLRHDIIMVSSVDEIPTDAVVYMSMPFSATGRYDPRYLMIENQMVIDLAYVGTTGSHHMMLRDNVEQVFWSGSKAFGLGNFRTGYKFTRIKDDLQDQIKDTGYYNWLGMEILDAALQCMSVTDAWDRVRETYMGICEECHLSPSDTYLIATTDDEAFLHLIREDGTIRVPIGQVLEAIHGMG